MDVDTSRASRREASKSVEPLNRAFDDPAVAVEALFGFDAAASDSLCDAAPPECRTAAVVVVALVGVKLRRSASKVASRSSDPRDGVDHGLEHPGVVEVRGRHADRGRDAFRVDRDVVF